MCQSGYWVAKPGFLPAKIFKACIWLRSPDFFDTQNFFAPMICKLHIMSQSFSEEKDIVPLSPKHKVNI